MTLLTKTLHYKILFPALLALLLTQPQIAHGVAYGVANGDADSGMSQPQFVRRESNEVIAGNPDTDGDGLDDSMEITIGTNPNDVDSDDGLNLNCFSEISGDNTTDFSSADASAVQQAVIAIGAGGTVKVAGICAGVQMISGTLQSTVITQNLTLAGGYTTTNWLATNDPVANPTILDALQAGRVIVVNADGVTVDALTIRNGLSSGSFGNNDGGGVLVNAGNTFSAGLRGNGGYAVISFEDSGPGIPPEIRPRLFEAMVTTRAQGTGLGLAIVRRVIEGLGGSIEEKGLPSSGASFRIILPLAPLLDGSYTEYVL